MKIIEDVTNHLGALLVTCGLGILHIRYCVSQVRDSVASHFDVAGNPDRWARAQEFWIVAVGLYLLLTVLFVVIPRVIQQSKDVRGFQ